MKLWILFILIPAVLLIGCVESPAPARQPSTEGVTLADLRSEVAEKPAPVMLFMVTTYLVDEAYAEAVQGCYDILPQDAIRFLDKKAFEANGFFASQGTGMQAGVVGDCLVRMGARQQGQTTLMLDAGAEVPFSETIIAQEQTIPYTSAGGGSETVSLQNGTLGWLLTARPDPEFPRRIHARIQPVFTPQGVLNWPGSEQYARKMAYRFDEGRFDVSFREADFVVLGSKRDSVEAMTTFERLLFLQPGGKPKMRLYVIICVKAEG